MLITLTYPAISSQKRSDIYVFVWRPFNLHKYILAKRTWSTRYQAMLVFFLSLDRIDGSCPDIDSWLFWADQAGSIRRSLDTKPSCQPRRFQDLTVLASGYGGEQSSPHQTWVIVQHHRWLGDLLYSHPSSCWEGETEKRDCWGLMPDRVCMKRVWSWMWTERKLKLYSQMMSVSKSFQDGLVNRSHRAQILLIWLSSIQKQWNYYRVATEYQ